MITVINNLDPLALILFIPVFDAFLVGSSSGLLSLWMTDHHRLSTPSCAALASISPPFAASQADSWWDRLL